MNTKTKKLAMAGVLCAIAGVAVGLGVGLGISVSTSVMMSMTSSALHALNKHKQATNMHKSNLFFTSHAFLSLFLSLFILLPDS